MSASFRKGELNKKLILAIGLLAIILIFVGAYYFFGSSGKNNSNENLPESGINMQNVDAEYAIAARASEQRSETLFSEGDSKAFGNQTLEIVKISQNGVLLKVGSETKIMGSGKEVLIGSLNVKVMSVSYSDNLEYRKVILRINNSGSSGGNNSEKSPKEITLAEGENAKFGDTEVKVSAIGSDSVSVTIGQDTRTILNGQWENFSGILVEIKGIFYTGVPGESKVVLLVTSGGN